MRKVAGILDVPQKNLASDVWIRKGGEWKLLSQIRDNLLNKAYSFVPKAQVMQILIIGSITGYKYKDTSDIDVNVSISPYDEKYKELRHDVNGFLATGTRHPVNYYFTEYSPNNSWEDAVFGVYDVLNDTWLSAPPGFKTVRNPNEEFYHSIAFAKMKSRQFDLAVRNLKNKLKTLTEAQLNSSGNPLSILSVQRYQRNAVEAYKRLLSLAVSIDEDRKLEYYLGWGTPRRNFRNIVYKLIEYGPHGRLFEYLKEID